MDSPGARLYEYLENKMKKFYDYEEIGGCEYPVFPGGSPDHEHPCDERAAYEVVFYDEGATLLDSMILCEKHFHEVIEGLEEV